MVIGASNIKTMGDNYEILTTELLYWKNNTKG